MRMRNRTSVLPCVENVAHDFIHARTMPDLRKNKLTRATHLASVAIHHGTFQLTDEAIDTPAKALRESLRVLTEASHCS